MMAEFDSINSEYLSVSPGFQQCQETTKSPFEHLMEKLRAKANKDPKHYKSWAEMTKALRIAIIDKRNMIDSVERTNLQKILDTLQKSIKVTSLQSMIERLESITRQQGLKFTGQSNTECCISSDMFRVEIMLGHSGEVNDVKIAHSKPVPCPQLTKVLRSGNFSEFTKHLEGLSAIYRWNADSASQLDCGAEKKLKEKAYAALSYLEDDLNELWLLQRSIKDVSNLVHKSPVGILQERQGGYSLKLTYFISPYDLLDVKTKSSITLTVDAVVEKGLGHSVTVCIESSNTHKLQTAPLITVPKNGEKSLPSFAAHSDLNSTPLPASFVLKLQDPIPMAVSILKKIQAVTKISNSADLSNSQSLILVIISDASKGKINTTGNKSLFVTLPDQLHCYNMKSNTDLQGVLVSTIPFTHPTHVPQILDFLRQQMLFNTIISSCVRPKSKRDIESALKFDIHAYSTNHIQVTFVHPLDESLAAVDLDLKEITAVKCKIHTLGMDDSLCSDSYASKIMQRCLSVPVTMRAVIRKTQGQQQQKKPDHNDMYSATVGDGTDVSYLPHMPEYGGGLANGSSLSGGHFSSLASRMCNKPMDGADNTLANLKSENIYSLQSRENANLETSVSSVLEQPSSALAASKVVDAHSDKIALSGKSSNIASGIPQSGNCNPKPPNTMLLSMLSDVPSATPSSAPFTGMCSKPRKRKATSDGRCSGSIGRSLKRKMSEDDSMRDQSSLDSPCSSSLSLGIDKSNSMPATLPSTSAETASVARTASSIDAYVKSEPTSHGYPQRSTSTDSYLTFRSQQVINSENSNPELSSISSLNLSHFKVESEHKGNDSNIDLDVGTCLNLMTDQISSSEKPVSDKTAKKIRKTKDNTDVKSDSQEMMVKTHDVESSESNSSTDVFHKSGTNADNTQSEDSSSRSKTSHFTHSSHPIIISRSLKIAKTGDGHKISKSESKMKQREGHRSTSEGSSGKKKNEGKKDRKRRQVQNADSVSSSHQIHLSTDSSLMPPPTSSPAELPLTMSACDTQIKRPITLNVKATSPSSSSQSKSPLLISSSSITGTSNPSKSSFTKTSSDKTSVKASSRTSHSSSSSKIANAEVDGEATSVTKVMLNTSLKLQSKHKQSSSSKGVSSSTHSVSHSSGHSSPCKTKSTSLKFKNSSLSSSSNPKSSSQILSASNIPHVATLTDEPTSPGNQGSKSHKSLLRSSKGTLSAVIDKLRVSATNAQHVPENPKSSNSGNRTDLSLERKESKLERKEGIKDSKDSSASKGPEGKAKYCSSDQFTVKQSSQGIKLTVTKTRSSDGSSKSGKFRSTSKTLSSSGTGNPSRNSSSGSNISKRGGSATPSTVKKSVSVSGGSLHGNPTHKSIHSSGSTKTGTGTGHKIISATTVPYQKVISSSSTTSKPTKVSVVPLQNKKEVPSHPEQKTISPVPTSEKCSTTFNVPVKVVPSPPTSKVSQLDNSWPLGGVPKRSEEPRPSPRLLSAQDDFTEEVNRERAFRLLLEQSKNERQNGSEQTMPLSMPSDSASKAVTAAKIEIEDKEFSLSSNTAIKKSSNPLKSTQERLNAMDQSISLLGDTNPITNADITCAKKCDTNVNATLVSSSEEINKPLPLFTKPIKQIECSNTHIDDASSPEDDLIIDYPGTPRLPDQKSNYQNKKDKSPSQKRMRTDNITNDERSDKYEYSQSSFISKTPDQLSPATPIHSRSLSHESCLIDDELMNMALTIGK